MINWLDNNIYNIIINLYNNNVTAVMRIISYTASATFLIIFALASFILLKNKKYAKLISINLALVFVTNRILKFIIKRPRPNALRLVTETGFSFPSGHAMVATGFYGLLIYLSYKKIKDKKLKYIAVTLLSLLVLLISVSRVYLGVHYATDVIGGMILGTIYLIIFIKYLYNKIVS